LPKTEQGKHKSAADEELQTKKSLGTLSPLGTHLAKVRTVREQTVNKNSLFMNNVHEHGVYIFLPIAALSA
jgi:hypothetical protein